MGANKIYRQISKTKLLDFVTHPFALALLFTIITVVFVAPVFKEYKGNVKSVSNVDPYPSSVYSFFDLDHDGYSERFKLYNWQNSSASINLYDNKDKLIDQYIFKTGLYNRYFSFLTGDFNNNGRDEIYFFTVDNDSLIYVNSLEVFNDTSYIRRSKFVDKVNLHNHRLDTNISTSFLEDLNGDGIKELVFFLFTGYALQPRRLYKWDIEKDTIISSAKAYYKFHDGIVADFNDDGNKEMIFTSAAPGNTKEYENLPFNDNNAWLIVFDKDLKIINKPFKFKGYGTTVHFEYVIRNNNKYVVAFEHNRMSGKEKNILYLFDKDLRLLKRRSYTQSIGHKLTKLRIGGQDFLIIKNRFRKQINFINIDLNIVKQKNTLFGDFFVKDVDLDGNDEIIYFNDLNNRFFIQRGDLKNEVGYDIYSPVTNSKIVISTKKNGNEHPEIGLQYGNKFYILSYYKDPYFFLQYPFYILVYLLYFVFFRFVDQAHRRRHELKYAHERELARLQIQSIKNQSDPHFIFNALNTIGAAIYRNDNETAYNFLNNFSALIRASIINSDKIQVSLQEELDFIDNYLQLEKLRFKDKFDYEIIVDENVSRHSLVPRMVLQSYVENAIKHGFMHSYSKGFLKIIISGQKGFLEIIIDDNGIGRKKAKEYARFSTGKGLSIMNRIYELYRKLHNIQISQEIEDKYDSEGNAAGTKVIIKIQQI